MRYYYFGPFSFGYVEHLVSNDKPASFDSLKIRITRVIREISIALKMTHRPKWVHLDGPFKA